MNEIKIHTLETRNYFLLDVMKKQFNLSFEDVGREIRSQYCLMIDELKLKGIKYSDLKNILIPDKNKKDIYLVFDTSSIKEAFYGYTIFKHYFPLLSKFTNLCVFDGDLIGSNENQQYIYNDMMKNLNIINKSIFKNSCQYYLIYINNLSIEKIKYLVNGLKSIKEFTGYFDFTYSCLLKEYISNIIGQRYFIYKKNIVMNSGYHEYNKENINTVQYDFEKYGFHIKSISDMNYNIFLTYKIERKYYDIDISDQLFSLSTISKKTEALQGFNINIEDRKLEYLLNAKYGSMRAGKILNLKKDEIETLIKKNINNNYIFNLEFNEKYNTIKFNTLLEIKEVPFKYLVSLEYIPENKELRLITMY